MKNTKNNSATSKIKQIYSLTPMQEGMLFHSRIDNDTAAYVTQSIFDSNSLLDCNYIKQTLNFLTEKYEVLKTIILYENLPKPRQVVLREKEIEFDFIDISLFDKETVENKLQEIYKDDVDRGFNVQKDSLLRVKCIKYSKSNCKLIFTASHILLDGWCISFIFQDFIHYYNLLAAGKDYSYVNTLVLDEKKSVVNYSEFVNWILNQDQGKAFGYWEQLLSGCDNIAEVPSLTIPESSDKQIEKILGNFSHQESLEISNFAISNQITVSTVMSTAWGIVLQKYNNADDIVYGKVVSGRNIDINGIENVLGMCINTVPVRVTCEQDETIISLLKKQQYQSIESANYEYCSLAEIQAKTQQGGHLINSVFAFENYYVKNEKDSGVEKSVCVTLEYMREQTNYPINITVNQNKDDISMAVIYNPNSYHKIDMEILLNKIKHMVKTIISTPNMKVSEIELITNEEKNIINKSNSTSKDYPADKTIIELFEEQVKIAPNKTAVVFGDTTLSYNELNLKSNSLSLKLKQMGIKANDYVAIIPGKCVEVIIGVCAILKAGGIYVAIDPKYPDSRIKYIFEDCKPKAILSCDKTFNYEELPVIDLFDNNLYEENIPNPINLIKPDDTANMIYTSGTTGAPKGVMIQHKNIVNLVCNNYDIGLNNDTIMTQTGTLAFDASTFEIWGILLNGGQLHVIDESVLLSAENFKKYVITNQINTVFLTTALFNQFVTEDVTIFDTVHRLMFGGEKANEECVKKLIKHNTKIDLKNLYGPTETTTFVLYYKIEQDSKKIPIGSPTDNTTVYVLNGTSLCGIGIPGELCIAGDGVAKGYLNKLDLTNEKFIKNPYDNGKLYKSGDLVRWLPDGNIEYLDRIDNQVKIRGFRIELTEIEKNITELDNINNCVVITKDINPQEKAIVAYVVSDEDIIQSDVKHRLSKFLPDYMIPTHIVQIDEIPINTNGKVDKKALQNIVLENQNTYIAPRNETEKILCEIFSEVLSTENIGINDNFFALGGHSLKVAKVVSLIESKLGYKLQLKDVFQFPTVEMLSKIVDDSKASSESHIPVAEEKEYYDMSSVEKRMYLVSQIDNTSIAYNINFGFEVNGKLDADRLKQALVSVMKRHEILRTEFKIIDGKAVQIIKDDVVPDFQVIERNNESSSELFSKFVKPFDLRKAPLVRMQYVKSQQSYEKDILFIDMHHIVSDGMSMGIFIKEFADFYNNDKCNMPLRQYKDYSEWINNKDLSSQEKFWIDKFNEDIPSLDMPLDFTRPKIQSFAGDVIVSKMSKEDSKAIKLLSRNYNSTEYMVFLSAIMILLHKYSRQNDIVVGSPISGRINSDTYNMLGMFVNTLAMRGEVNPNRKFSEFLEEIRAQCLEAFDNQEYPFEMLVEKLNIKRDLSRNPLFDIMLVMQNNEIPDMSLDNIKLSLLPQQEIVSKFDITFNVVEKEGFFEITSEFCTDLYKKSSVETITKHLISILHQITAAPDIEIKNLVAITAEEENKILYDFNDTDAVYPSDKTVVEIFEKQVKKTPDNTAVIFNEQSLTYSELNKKANALALTLRNLGVKPNDSVAIITERSLEMIVGIYGIIKSGGAYLPIAPNCPNDRINYILEDAQPKAVLVYNKTIEIDENIPILNLEDFINHEGVSENLSVVNKPEDLLYIIFTSGTTGRPKGVMCHNTGCINRIMWMNSRYPVLENDRILQKTTFTFDVSVWEIFWWCFVGATVVMLNNGDEMNPQAICDTIYNNKVNVIHFVPSMLSAFLLHLENNINSSKYLESLNYVFASGEALKNSQVHKFKKYINDTGNKAKLVNLYGPTEASIDVTYYDCNGTEKIVPIGKPIDNIKLYVMNDSNLCGIGVPGELCITGVGLAKGYINNPKITKEKFVNNPYGKGQLYHTGDLVKWMPDGNIEYLGRIDEQVKIRGFRIELGEIENVLKKISYIKDCAVVVKEDLSGEKQICAYIISDTQIDSKSIKEELKKSIPDYMIPNFIMAIDSIPVTANGKLNKKLLPDIEMIHSGEYISPRDEVEENLVEIYKKILCIDKISVTDNFFDIGGNSLKLVSVFNDISVIYPNTIKIADIFAYPTIESLAYYINNHIDTENNKCEIVGIELIEECINYSENPNGDVLSYNMNTNIINKLNNICSTIQCNIEDIFSAIYMYLLSKVSTNQNLYIQVFDGKTDLVSQINMYLTEIDNLFDVVNNVNKLLANSNAENQYRLSDLMKKSITSKSEVIPLFVFNCENNVADFSKFDIVLEYRVNSEGDYSLNLNYNSNKLSSEKFYQIFSDYINIVDMIANN